MVEAIASVGHSVSAAYESLVRLLCPDPAQERPVRLLSEYARRVTEEVLKETTDRDDLFQRIHALVGDLELFQSLQTLFRPSQAKPSEILASAKLDLTSLTAVLGQTAAQRCERGFTALKILARCI